MVLKKNQLYDSLSKEKTTPLKKPDCNSQLFYTMFLLSAFSSSFATQRWIALGQFPHFLLVFQKENITSSINEVFTSIGCRHVKRTLVNQEYSKGRRSNSINTPAHETM